jgi:hypothetical protein
MYIKYNTEAFKKKDNTEDAGRRAPLARHVFVLCSIFLIKIIINKINKNDIITRFHHTTHCSGGNYLEK